MKSCEIEGLSIVVYQERNDSPGLPPQPDTLAVIQCQGTPGGPDGHIKSCMLVIISDNPKLISLRQAS